MNSRWCYFPCVVQVHDAVHREMIVIGQIVREYDNLYLVKYNKLFEFNKPELRIFEKQNVTLIWG